MQPKKKRYLTSIVGRSISFSVLAGAVFAFAVSLLATIWEWFENAGGIFRGGDGTNWGFVTDTAVSWFLPTFAWIVVPVLAANLTWRWFRQR